MAAVTEAFVSVHGRAGIAIGVLPGVGTDSGGTPPGYPNRNIELAIRTHLPSRGEEGTLLNSRNHINVLSADVVIALPGGTGTRSEVDLAVRYNRPCVAFLDNRGQLPLPADVPHVTTVEDVATYVLRHVTAGLARF